MAQRMKVKVIDQTEEFIVLEATDAGVPPKRISIHIDSIADGRTTLDEQVAKAKDDCKERGKRIKAMKKAIKDLEKG